MTRSSALALIDRNDMRVDLLLTDVVLPGMNGGGLAKEVKARRPEASVLFMTGYSPGASRSNGRSMAASRCCTSR